MEDFSVFYFCVYCNNGPNLISSPTRSSKKAHYISFGKIVCLASLPADSSLAAVRHLSNQTLLILNAMMYSNLLITSPWYQLLLILHFPKLTCKEMESESNEIFETRSVQNEKEIYNETEKGVICSSYDEDNV